MLLELIYENLHIKSIRAIWSYEFYKKVKNIIFTLPNFLLYISICLNIYILLADNKITLKNSNKFFSAWILRTAAKFSHFSPITQNSRKKMSNTFNAVGKLRLGALASQQLQHFVLHFPDKVKVVARIQSFLHVSCQLQNGVLCGGYDVNCRRLPDFLSVALRKEWVSEKGNSWHECGWRECILHRTAQCIAWVVEGSYKCSSWCREGISIYIYRRGTHHWSGWTGSSQRVAGKRKYFGESTTTARRPATRTVPAIQHTHKSTFRGR